MSGSNASRPPTTARGAAGTGERAGDATAVVLRVPTRSLARGLTGMIVALTLLSVAWQAAYLWLGWEQLGSPSRYYDLNRERNLPTWCQGLTLLASAVVLWGIASNLEPADSTAAGVDGGARSWRAHWRGLSLIFAYLACDELFKWHERTVDPLRAWLGTDAGGFLLYAWVVPAAAAGFVVAAAYARFFFVGLPPDTRRRFALAAGLLIGGAVGMEVVSGRVHVSYGWGSIPYRAVAHVEEVLEMAGQCAFLLALARHAHRHLPDGGLRYGPFRLRFLPPERDGNGR